MRSEKPGSIVWLPMLGMLLLSACTTNTTLTVADRKYQPVEASCAIRFFTHGKRPPSAYESLAKIESHIQKNMFFGKTAKLEEDAYAELKTKACSVGGNAVLIDDYVESTAAEFSHVHVWATAIKLN